MTMSWGVCVMEINFDRLRSDLINYYGSGIYVYPIALLSVIKVDMCSEEELIKIALSNNFNLEKYKEAVNNDIKCKRKN